MIPDFDENGYLPPGIHSATMDEIEDRFGRESELRRVEMQSLRWLVSLARQVGVQRIVINGSFVTDAFEPNDVDCTLLIGPDSALDSQAAKELTEGLPFLQVELASPAVFDVMVNQVYASDRFLIPKGVVEIIQWN